MIFVYSDFNKNEQQTRKPDFFLLIQERFEFGRGSRERRTPLSEIATDTPPIWQRDTGQPRRCAMVRPRHEGTPYVIEVTLRPGKYELLGAQSKIHFYPRDDSLWCLLSILSSREVNQSERCSRRGVFEWKNYF